MNLGQQVTSLDLSKRLSQLGIKQKSLFYWEWVNDNCYGIKYFPYCVTPKNVGEFLHYSAFNASELLYMLPVHVDTKEDEPFNNHRLFITASFIVKDTEVINPIRTHIINYKCDTMDLTNMDLIAGRLLTKNIWDENPANALAKMIIYLIENKLFEVTKC